MKVTFEYESAHKRVSRDEFRHDLKSFLDFMVPMEYHGNILDNDKHLYKDRVLVMLVRKFADLNSMVYGGIFDAEEVISERDSLAWLIADLL